MNTAITSEVREAAFEALATFNPEGSKPLPLTPAHLFHDDRPWSEEEFEELVAFLLDVESVKMNLIESESEWREKAEASPISPAKRKEIEGLLRTPPDPEHSGRSVFGEKRVVKLYDCEQHPDLAVFCGYNVLRGEAGREIGFAIAPRDCRFH